jgi:hypothetical protein
MISKQTFMDGFDDDVRRRRHQITEDAGFLQVAMTQQFFEYLKDADTDLNDFIPCPFNIEQGVDSKGKTSLHGYSMDEDSSRLDLFVFHQVAVTGTAVTPQEIRLSRDQAYRFYKRAIDGYHEKLEEANEAHSAMAQIFEAQEDITSIRIYVFTNGQSPRAKLGTEKEDGVTIESNFWDIDRLYKQFTSGGEREEIVVDFVNDHGAPVSALLCDSGESGYKCYVGFLSGHTIAEMYARHSSRLIEQNVRMFLQARGSVNSGIQKTIKDEPDNFLAYNNGMSLTAKSVECVGDIVNGQCQIGKVTELQIVNGAQTSGSIFHARQKERNLLRGVWVQFKLTVPDDGKSEPQFYSNISKYANSQNKVRVTDLSANHPFHQKIEQLSRAIVTPNRNDGTSLSHWFYERARGAYLIDKGNQPNASARTAWEKSNPKGQSFTKVDLAKSEVIAWGQPHIVSRGGEKNFSMFMLEVEDRYPEINEKLYKDMVSRLILFRSMEKIVAGLGQGGYRANVVAYSLSYLYLKYDGRIDYTLFWSKQFDSISDRLKEALETLAKEAYAHIMTPPAGISNLSEWAKKKECWDTFNVKTIDLKLTGEDGFGERHQGERMAEGTLLSGEMASAKTWMQLAVWSKDRDDFNRRERAFVKFLVLAATKRSGLAPRQMKWAKEIWAKAARAGFTPRP